MQWLKENAINLAIIVVVIITLISGVWYRVAAPCSWFSWWPNKEIPGRCVNTVEAR